MSQSGPAGAEAAPPPASSPLLQFVPFIGILVIFYFLLFLPARRRQKETRRMLDALKNGDRIITTGGIYGTVVGVDGEKVQLRIADQVKIDVTRSAIAGLQNPPEK